MGIATRCVAPVFVGALVLGCESEQLVAQNEPLPPRFALDSGVVPSRPTPDAGPTTPPVAQCLCPATPPSCRLPPADAPVYSTDRIALQTQLVDHLTCAETSIKAALYDTTWGCAVDMLLNQLDRNHDLTIELVIDDDLCPLEGGVRTCALSRVQAHPRVTIVDDARSRLMHHKFIIVDDARVWVSSANMTESSFCDDVNDAIIVAEPEVVAAFGAEFSRLMDAREFGPVDPRGPFAGGPYHVYFGPESPISEPGAWFSELLATIDGASTSIDFMIFAWTRDEVAEALVRAHTRGVLVRGVVDGAYANRSPAVTVREAGVDLRTAPVHSKILIVDGQQVAAGSANWSANAWANNETSLWVDDATIASAYAAGFELVYTAADKTP